MALLATYFDFETKLSLNYYFPFYSIVSYSFIHAPFKFSYSLYWLQYQLLFFFFFSFTFLIFFLSSSLNKRARNSPLYLSMQMDVNPSKQGLANISLGSLWKPPGLQGIGQLCNLCNQCYYCNKSILWTFFKKRHNLKQ